MPRQTANRPASGRPAAKAASRTPAKASATAASKRTKRPAARSTTRKPARQAAKREAKPLSPAARDTARRIDGLHGSWRDAMEAYRLRVEGQFRLVEGALKQPKRRGAKDIQKVRDAVKLQLKPRKGRAKDLRRVEDALGRALSHLRGD
jgi:hypothetical protein